MPFIGFTAHYYRDINLFGSSRGVVKALVDPQRGESTALEGRCVSSKSPSRVRDGYERVAGRNGREKYFPNKLSLFCPLGKPMIFYKNESE